MAERKFTFTAGFEAVYANGNVIGGWLLVNGERIDWLAIPGCWPFVPPLN